MNYQSIFQHHMKQLSNQVGHDVTTYNYNYVSGEDELMNAYAQMRNDLGYPLAMDSKYRRTKFEDIRDSLSNSVCKQYDEAKTYHDGKWVMFEPTNMAEFDDYMKLLAIKRKPNRK